MSLKVGWFLVYIMHLLSHTTVNKLYADITGFFASENVSQLKGQGEGYTDRVKADPIKYNNR